LLKYSVYNGIVLFNNIGTKKKDIIQNNIKQHDLLKHSITINNGTKRLYSFICEKCRKHFYIIKFTETINCPYGNCKNQLKLKKGSK